MKFRFLGPSGLRVSELCLGTMTFGEDWGWGASKEESRAMFDFSVELIRSTVNTQSLCVNIKNEGKGVGHNPIFDYYLERNNAVLVSGNQELQTIGAGSAENLIFNTSGPVPTDGILRLYWKGTRSDGRAFNGSREIPLSSATVTTRQFGVS